MRETVIQLSEKLMMKMPMEFTEGKKITKKLIKWLKR